MLPKKKTIKDFFPNFFDQLSFEDKWPCEKWQAIEKYNVVGWGAGNQGFPVRHDNVVNFAPNAKILAFKIDFNDINDCIVTIDFSSTDSFNEFKQISTESIQNLLTPIESGFLVQERRRNVNWLPQANPISYFTTIVNSPGVDRKDEKREMVDKIIIAIQKIDPLDIKTIKELNKACEFIGLKSTKFLIELEKNIRERLSNRHARGSGMGLFTQKGYPAELGAIVGDHITDPQTRLNLAMICKQTAITSALETEKEAENISKIISSFRP